MLEFLRDVGKHFTVNQMMAKDSVRSRLDSEHGISFTEFSYMLLQANDFRHLYEHHDVELQAGASDQWGNIVAGVDLIRRRLGAAGVRDDASADDRRPTAPSSASRSGERCGSTRQRTSPYQFRQFWVQMRRRDGRHVPEDAVDASARRDRGAAGRARGVARDGGSAQRALADEMTTLVHGAEAAAAAGEAADVLFGGDPDAEPRRRLWRRSQPRCPLVDSAAIARRASVCTSCSCKPASPSRTARSRACSAKARCGPEIGCSTPTACCTASDLLRGQFLLLRKGKRDFVVGKSLTEG